MSILNPTPDPATDAATQVSNIALQQYTQLQNSGVRGYNLIWQNPKATPAQVIAALGTNAKVIFELANLNIQTLTSAAALAGVSAPTLPEVPANYTLTFNDDGTGVLVEADSLPKVL